MPIVIPPVFHTGFGRPGSTAFADPIPRSAGVSQHLDGGHHVLAVRIEPIAGLAATFLAKHILVAILASGLSYPPVRDAKSSGDRETR